MRVNINEDPRTIIRENVNLAPKPRKRFNFKFVGIYLLILFVIGLLSFSIFYIILQNSLKDVGLEITPLDAISIVTEQFEKKTEITVEDIPQLNKDSSGTVTNIMIVGVDTRPGENSGLLNTDTIILASYNHKTESVTMVSIPRDTIVQMPGSTSIAKINSLYMIGEQVQKDNGLPYLKSAVESYTGQNINYFVLVNFKAFIEVIDAMGGIDVNVENTFTDYSFPDLPAGQALHFDQGVQHMDGTTALRFVRSRHSYDNGEGSDFARARRQQRVVEAVKSKVVSSETLLNPTTLFNMISALQNNIQFSGYSLNDINAGIYLLKNDKIKSTYSTVLDIEVNNRSLLTDQLGTTLGYSITPIAGLTNYSQIQNYVRKAVIYPATSVINPSIAIYNCGEGETTISAIENSLKNDVQQSNFTTYNTCPFIVESNQILTNTTRDISLSAKEIRNAIGFPPDTIQSILGDTTEKAEIIILITK
jgi:LCP family protein required for cell wall assembly